MDLLKHRLDIARKIVQELVGTIEEEDQRDLNRWLEEDERHRVEYEKIREVLKSKNDIREAQEEGRHLLESRWRVVKARTIRKPGRRIVWSRYAAAIMLPLFVGILLFINKDERADVSAVIVSSINHGGVKAQLELADGRKMELNHETRLQIEETGGVKIQTVDNMVKYTGQDTLIGQLVGEKYNTLTVPQGGEFSLELVDGTRVWLNAESRLRYPVHFTGNERKVEMEGEVYFEVAKDKEKPFVVSVNGMDIRVLGTSFNVSAYRESVITTLVEGKVQLKKGRESVILTPNQQGVWAGNRFEVKQVEARNYTLWKDGIFYFEDELLETILGDMARWYSVNIFYVNPVVKSMKFSVEIKRYENIDEILRRIEQTKRVKFEIKDKTINVYE